MDQLLERLWVGDMADAATVYDDPGFPPVDYVLNLSQFPPPSATRSGVVWYPIQDEVFLNPQVWDTVTGFMRSILDSEWRLLVHCRLGKSRSVAACAAYLIRCGESPTAALAQVRACREKADPHEATWASVLSWAQHRFGLR